MLSKLLVTSPSSPVRMNFSLMTEALPCSNSSQFAEVHTSLQLS